MVKPGRYAALGFTMKMLNLRRSLSSNCSWGIILWTCAAFQGCSTQGQLVPEGEVAATASFYWPYAALATDVYRTEGKFEEKLQLAGSSPWLRREIAMLPPDQRQAAIKQAGLDSTALAAMYKQYVADRCNTSVTASAEAGSSAAFDCLVPNATQESELVAGEDRLAESNRSIEGTPRAEQHCDDDDGKEPLVPVTRAMQKYGWERAPEFQRDALPRGWRVFVPELAVDVWRRPLPPDGDSPVVEYAIVYRGTVGGGGWLSNFRALTAYTPFIWDQYRQAQITTQQIVRQMKQVHALSDAIFRRQRSTKIHITAVGHSLGAGLASYIFLRVMDIDRVVGFDPSPVDGASLIGLENRALVMSSRSQPIHSRDGDRSGAAIHLLFEKGEVISRVAPCHDGPIWGAEGGPVVRCESVDFSRGSIFRQHNMARLACMLFLVAPT